NHHTTYKIYTPSLHDALPICPDIPLPSKDYLKLSEIKDLETNLRKYGVPKDLAQKATLGDFCVLQRFAGCGAFGHEGLRHREDGRGTNYRCVCLPYWFGITGKLFARQKAKVIR